MPHKMNLNILADIFPSNIQYHYSKVFMLKSPIYYYRFYGFDMILRKSMEIFAHRFLCIDSHRFKGRIVEPIITNKNHSH